MNEKLRIVFMGTPEFAVESLKEIINSDYQVVAAVTAPDKKAGRGQQIRYSPVKEFCLQHQIPVLQPEKLKTPEFLDELSALKPDLMIVVAFRMLPEQVWKMPRLGTFNLHASLLPDYRGAAPINHALINGDTTTGLTTFFLEKEIDTGKIIMQEEIAIDQDENAGSLHDRLMMNGAKLVVRTIRKIESGDLLAIPQNELIRKGLAMRPAPKIFTETCRIDWNQSAPVIHNLIRGLSPYPAAWTNLSTPEGERSLKIYKSHLQTEEHSRALGEVVVEQRKGMKVAVRGGWIHLLELQQSGKKRMPVHEFLQGFPSFSGWRME
jgi:methionyl-tRNA formyltransferase